MDQLDPKTIAAMHTGKIEMTRDGETWTDDEKCTLVSEYFSGTDITTLAYLHQRTESAIMQQLVINHAIKNCYKSRQPYKTKRDCQCYRCSKRGTPECRMCKQGEVNDPDPNDSDVQDSLMNDGMFRFEKRIKAFSNQ